MRFLVDQEGILYMISSNVVGFKQNVLLSILLGLSPVVLGEVIFTENFDSQPDWHSGLPENRKSTTQQSPGADHVQIEGTHIVPEGWYSVRQDPLWAPSVGHADKHETIEILERNASKARGGVGKSFVSWRDSGGLEWRWNSDGQLTVYFPDGYEQLYVEFWIQFSPEWTTQASADISKLFRIGSWSGEGSIYQAFSGGEQGPLFLWDWKRDLYGVRNVHSLRGGPHGDNYNFTAEDISDHPRGSMNFTTDTVGMGLNGETPLIKDLVNGGYISDNMNQTVTHEQVYGEAGTWTKVAFYVSMNSAPDIQDGILQQWINDERILNVGTIPWVKSSEGDKMVKWNFVSFGGNDYFHTYDDSIRREEWYSIDDIVIATSPLNAPLPPINPVRVDSQD